MFLNQNIPPISCGPGRVQGLELWVQCLALHRRGHARGGRTHGSQPLVPLPLAKKTNANCSAGWCGRWRGAIGKRRLPLQWVMRAPNVEAITATIEVTPAPVARRKKKALQTKMKREVVTLDGAVWIGSFSDLFTFRKRTDLLSTSVWLTQKWWTRLRQCPWEPQDCAMAYFTLGSQLPSAG